MKNWAKLFRGDYRERSSIESQDQKELDPKLAAKKEEDASTTTPKERVDRYVNTTGQKPPWLEFRKDRSGKVEIRKVEPSREDLELAAVRESLKPQIIRQESVGEQGEDLQDESLLEQVRSKYRAYKSKIFKRDSRAVERINKVEAERVRSDRGGVRGEVIDKRRKKVPYVDSPRDFDVAEDVRKNYDRLFEDRKE